MATPTYKCKSSNCLQKPVSSFLPLNRNSQSSSSSKPVPTAKRPFTWHSNWTASLHYASVPTSCQFVVQFLRKPTQLQLSLQNKTKQRLSTYRQTKPSSRTQHSSSYASCPIKPCTTYSQTKSGEFPKLTARSQTQSANFSNPQL